MAIAEQIFKAVTRILIIAGIVLLGLAVVPESAAQYRTLAVGVEVGSPSGITILLPSDRRYAFEILGAWDLDDFLFVNGHALFTRSVDDYPELHAIWGPGVFIGVRDNANDAASLGVSGKFGAGYDIDPFEIYIHLTPRFELISETDFHLGGGIGLRFFPNRN